MMLWEVGILLMGIGVLILCIFAATTIRDLGATFKRIDRMLTDKNGEIETIITNTANITTEVDGIASNVNRFTDISGIVESVSNIFKKEETTQDLYSESFQEDLFDKEMSSESGSFQKKAGS